MLHVSETHVSSLPHVVLQILPAAAGRKTRHNNAKFRSARRGPKPSPWSSSRRSTKFGSRRSWIFHTQLTVSKSISIPSKDGVLRIPWVLKSHKGKRDGASVVLQLNIPNFSIFKEEILNIPLLDFHGKVSHVDSSVRHGLKPTGPAAFKEIERFPCQGVQNIQTLVRPSESLFLQL